MPRVGCLASCTTSTCAEQVQRWAMFLFPALRSVAPASVIVVLQDNPDVSVKALPVQTPTRKGLCPGWYHAPKATKFNLPISLTSPESSLCVGVLTLSTASLIVITAPTNVATEEPLSCTTSWPRQRLARAGSAGPGCHHCVARRAAAAAVSPCRPSGWRTSAAARPAAAQAPRARACCAAACLQHLAIARRPAETGAKMSALTSWAPVTKQCRAQAQPNGCSSMHAQYKHTC
jgi:hypothetical protein